MEVFWARGWNFQATRAGVVRHAPDERRGDGRGKTRIWQSGGTAGAEHEKWMGKGAASSPKTQATWTD